MGNLTALKIKNEKDVGRLADGSGLFFEVLKSGLRRWVYRYKITGKQGVFILGQYPEISLSLARDLHHDARILVKKGINPAQARKEDKAANIAKQQEAKIRKNNLFKQVAMEWFVIAQQGKHKGNAKPWTEKHKKAVLSSLERDVFPCVGDMPIDTIEATDLMPIIDRMTDRGVYDNTRKVIQRVNMVFNFGIIKQKCKQNPCVILQGLLPIHKVRHHPAVFDKELGQLMRDITACQRMHLSTKLALFFVAYTVLRSNEARLATWDEVDMEARELHIDEERMKKGRAHIVPLSEQALAIINHAGDVWGREGLIFPSPLSNQKPLSDNTLSKAFRNLGYQGKAVVHGLRASFSTMAYEHKKFEGEVIETSLAHVLRNKTQAAYNRSMYLEKRHKLMQWWGDKLQALEQSEAGR